MLDKLFGAGKPAGTEKKPGASADDFASPAVLPKPRRANLEKRFTLIAETGQGSMSRVYRASDNESGRTVCLKVQDSAKQAAAAARSAQAERPSEGAIGLCVQHPNVVRTLEFGVSTKGDSYIVMEFVDGYGLNFVHQSRRCDLAAKVELLAQAAEGLAAIHAAGFIHHDVGPKNILVDRDDRVKVIDFGLAVPNTPAFHRPGNRTGTLNYMAPELLRREPTDERLDIFSFGVTMFEFLTGKLPYDSANSMAAMLQRINHDPLDIAKAGTPLPDDLCEVVRKAMARSAKDRWPSMAALAEALRELSSLASASAAPAVSEAEAARPETLADDVDFLEALGVAVPETPAHPSAEAASLGGANTPRTHEAPETSDAEEHAPDIHRAEPLAPEVVPSRAAEAVQSDIQDSAHAEDDEDVRLDRDASHQVTLAPDASEALAPSRGARVEPTKHAPQERPPAGQKRSGRDRDEPADVDFFDSLGVNASDPDPNLAQPEAKAAPSRVAGSSAPASEAPAAEPGQARVRPAAPKAPRTAQPRTKPARPAVKTPQERGPRGAGSRVERESGGEVDFFDSLGVVLPDPAATPTAETKPAGASPAGAPAPGASAPQPRSSTIPKEVRKFVWARDGGRCVLCGGHEELKFKHIVPVARGGTDTPENIRLLCKPCRHRKPSAAQESA